VNIKNVILIILYTLFLIPIVFVSSHAASSTNVTLENDLYRDMEFWAAEGLIESQLSSIKPLARNEVGKQILAAMDKCDAMKKNLRLAEIFRSITRNFSRGKFPRRDPPRTPSAHL
jgi:hypothetical protein